MVYLLYLVPVNCNCVGGGGHSVGETSYGKIYGTHPEDLIETAVVARGMRSDEWRQLRRLAIR